MDTDKQFAKDLERGKVGEKIALEYFKKKLNNPLLTVPNSYHPEGDVFNPHSERWISEVKSDYKSYFTPNITVEYMSRNKKGVYKNSSISTTISEYWTHIYYDNDYPHLSEGIRKGGAWILLNLKVEMMRDLCKVKQWKRIKDAGAFKNAKVILIPKREIIENLNHLKGDYDIKIVR